MNEPASGGLFHALRMITKLFEKKHCSQ